MKIGITERGDAGLDLSWAKKLDTVDGAILITKNITDGFVAEVGKAIEAGHKLIIHVTCTGYGGTVIEPNVPPFDETLYRLENMIYAIPSLAPAQIVLRIDPVFPTEKGLKKVCNVLNFVFAPGPKLLDGCRIRMSLIDEYKHVNKRFADAGFRSPYKNGKPSEEQLDMVIKTFSQYRYHTPYHKFETCAETELANRAPEIFEKIGCVSMRDIGIMNLTLDRKTSVNPQGRSGCLCLGCKTELLENKCRCPHQCLYCYWRDK